MTDGQSNPKEIPARWFGRRLDRSSKTAKFTTCTHNLLHRKKLQSGGPDQVRTDDLLNAIEALFQLSYEPIHLSEGEKTRFFQAERKEFLETPDRQPIG
jgi:hypothetical protein